MLGYLAAGIVVGPYGLRLISESEALYHGLSEKKFTVWDTNGDDTLTEAEYEKGIEEKNDVDGSTEDY